MSIRKVEVSAIVYDAEMIEALAQFQNYGGSGVFSADAAKMMKMSWPPKFTHVKGPIFRVMCLERSLVNKVLAGRPYQINHVSSWSKSKEIAKEFVNSHWFDEFYDRLRDPVVVLLRLDGQLRGLDIDAIHKDPQFKGWVEYYEDEGRFFNEGLEFGDSQREVAVPSFILSRDIIVDGIDKPGAWLRKG